MSRIKFISFSILKTWLISIVVSTIILILYMSATREVREYPRSCDMSGLAYAFVIFWITFLSVLSMSSLLSLLKLFQGKITTALCWFLLPVVASVGSLFVITDGKIYKLGGEDIILLLLMNLPWLIIWSFFYYRLNIRFSNSH